jgi:2-polyprenyl-6-hydroxyphenyl methylase/3-demethylubiquinone-9 3-methyltransferase
MTTPNGGYFLNRLPKFSECVNPDIYESVQFQPNAEGHIFLLHPEEISGLARPAGLSIEKMILFTNPLTAGHLKTESLLRVLPKRLIDIIESASRGLPFAVKRRALVQIGVRFRKTP